MGNQQLFLDLALKHASVVLGNAAMLPSKLLELWAATRAKLHVWDTRMVVLVGVVATFRSCMRCTRGQWPALWSCFRTSIVASYGGAPLAVEPWLVVEPERQGFARAVAAA